MAGPPVESVMTANPMTAKPDTPIREALQLLEDMEIRHLPVLDDGRLVGIVSDRDLREFRLPLFQEMDNPDFAEELAQTPVSAAMSSLVISVETGEDLGSAIDAMMEHGVGAVPVVERDGDTLVGIVSYVDVLRVLRAIL
jgi:acetoin utilization protein AcuB